MKRKLDKKRIRLISKLMILMLCFFITLKLFQLTLSKFETKSSSDANMDVAFYLLKEDYQTMTLNLSSLYPRKEPFIYEFSISNREGEKVAETNLQYEFSIRTTTNLPLTYELYKNQRLGDTNLATAILNNRVEADEYGTYFRKIDTATEELYFDTPKTNTYQLLIYFPETYNSIEYQNIIESMQIMVTSRQKID